jgi:hypothetical protein
MYPLTKPRGGNDGFLHFAVFPIPDVNFVEIEHQFGYTTLCVIVQIPNCSLEKRSRHLQALLFLPGTFFVNYLIRMLNDERICPSSSKSDLKLRCTMI